MRNLIKFGLPINGIKVHYLEQLKENFVIDEVIDLHKSKLLQNWLNHLGYTHESEQLNALNDSMDKQELEKSFIEIFNLRNDQIIQLISVDQDKLTTEELHNITHELLCENYDHLKRRIILQAKPLELPVLDKASLSTKKSQLKTEVNTLVEKYSPLLAVDPFYCDVCKSAPFFFLLLLGHESCWASYDLNPSIKHIDSISNRLPNLIDPGYNKTDTDNSLSSSKPPYSYVEAYIKSNFNPKFASLFEKKDVSAGFKPTEDGWDRLFDAGKYLIWVENPQLIEIRSVEEQSKTTMHHYHLYLVEGLEYKCQPDSNGTATIYTFEVE